MLRTPVTISVQDARQAIRAAGLRSTTSRVAVLQHVAAAGKPVSHAEVADALVPQGYRQIDALPLPGRAGRRGPARPGWTRATTPGGSSSKTEEHASGEHPHFVCVDCGKVTCLPDVDVKISPAKGAKAASLGNVTEVFFKGHCKECQ